MAKPPRIAIPVPHSQKPDYAQRSLPQYIKAVEKSGGHAVVIQLDLPSEEVARQISGCHAVLLPGSPADVDPQKYGAAKLPETAAADPLRDAVDELLLQDAHNMRKPIFGICYGLQSLNVWRTGTLVQDIPSLLRSPVNHEAGRGVAYAHPVTLDPVSKLAAILNEAQKSEEEEIEVNSSHHQSAAQPGDGLRIAARCPADGVIEALEGTDSEHFVLAVQWHPERGFEADAASQALFRAFVTAARNYRLKI